MTIHELPVLDPLITPALRERPVRAGAPYRLAELPYPVTALEPHLPADVLWLHHDVHHATHVAGANRALAALQVARDANDWSDVNQLERDLSFHVSGHVLHSLFWQHLSPAGGGQPTGVLASSIAEGFGSFAAMRDQFTRAALALQGSGWVGLAWEPLSERLVIVQLHDNDRGSPPGVHLLLVCDVWEHAYLRQHRDDRAAWLDAFWQMVGWGSVAWSLHRVLWPGLPPARESVGV